MAERGCGWWPEYTALAETIFAFGALSLMQPVAIEPTSRVADRLDFRHKRAPIPRILAGKFLPEKGHNCRKEGDHVHLFRLRKVGSRVAKHANRRFKWQKMRPHWNIDQLSK